MAEGGNDSASDRQTVDVQIMECNEEEEENFECVVPTQNRFVDNNGQQSGRGSSGWQRVRNAKRKKVSSGSTENIDSINPSTFDSLSNNDKLSCLFELAFKNLNILNDVKNEQTTFCRTVTKLKSSVDSLHTQADRTDMVTEKQTRCLKMLAYRSIDTEARSRRNNIIFWGISEKSHIRLDELILNFLEDEMSVDVTHIVVDRVHRIGSARSFTNREKQDPKRPVIVRFRDYADTERVMRNAYTLKGTPFGVDRDYPREIAVARKELYRSEEAKHARENRARLQIRYPAKLFIDGKFVKDSFPEWHQYINQDRIASLQEIESVQNAHEDSDTESSCDDGDDDDDSYDDGDDDDDSASDYSEYVDQKSDSVFQRSTEIETSEESDDNVRVKTQTDARQSTNKTNGRRKKSVRKGKRVNKSAVNKINLPMPGVSHNNAPRKQRQQQKSTQKVNPVVNNNTTNKRKHTDVNTQQNPRVTKDNVQSTRSVSINRHGENQNRQRRDTDNKAQRV